MFLVEFLSKNKTSVQFDRSKGDGCMGERGQDCKQAMSGFPENTTEGAYLPLVIFCCCPAKLHPQENNPFLPGLGVECTERRGGSNPPRSKLEKGNVS